ncbi:hypothetical protein GCM10009100_09670 [Thalassospira tepidiphila]
MLAHRHLTDQLAPGFKAFAHAGGIGTKGCVKTSDGTGGMGAISRCGDLLAPEFKKLPGKLVKPFVIGV